jgi:hypothetical protein
MLSERELRIRRLAYELWERAGQRGSFSDYMDHVAAQFDLDSEHDGESPASSRELPSESR